jgi:formylglycine-generating enzyme required for sulfatase activity
MQKPLEFHASTSELVQLLEKGHYGVELDAEAWDRLVTWIDLNVPDHGTWHEHRGGRSPWEERRLAMRTKYAGRPEDPEAIPETQAAVEPVAFVEPKTVPQRPVRKVDCPGWPFDEAAAQRLQAESGEPSLQVDLPGGSTLEMVLIPAGQFVLGSAVGPSDEYPPTRVQIEKPFYMGRFEITNAQYSAFDPQHDSAYISMPNKDHGNRGYPVNQPDQPVVRITWQQAMEFCRRLSAETGRRFTLPTEAQWEWACRAGSDRPFWYGDLNTDFSRFANLADLALDKFARGDSPPWQPKDRRFDDRAMVTVPVGRYQPNAWGLCDMHGNVAEWTRTAYRPYPYDAGDGRDAPSAAGDKVARGGSWYDRPERARSAFRLHYEPWQPVYNVGFRVIAEIE